VNKNRITGARTGKISIPRAAENVETHASGRKEKKKGKKKEKKGKKKERKKKRKNGKIFVSESSEWYFGAVNKGHRFRF